MKKAALAFLGLGSIIALLVVFGSIISQNQVRVQLDALKTGMAACAEAAAPPPATNISPQRLREVIQDDIGAPRDKRHLLPSFIAIEDVYVSTNSVMRGSPQVFCAVRLGKHRYYAARGNGSFALVDEKAMRTLGLVQ